MNIFNLLTKKQDVSYLIENMSVKKALSEISRNGFTAVPIISSEGVYINTITEGDFLRFINNNGFDISGFESIPVSLVPIRRETQSVHVMAKLPDLVELAKTQNFVPVVDDRGIFIGIVTRKDLIVYATNRISELEKTAENAHA